MTAANSAAAYTTSWSAWANTGLAKTSGNGSGPIDSITAATDRVALDEALISAAAAAYAAERYPPGAIPPSLANPYPEDIVRDSRFTAADTAVSTGSKVAGCVSQYVKPTEGASAQARTTAIAELWKSSSFIERLGLSGDKQSMLGRVTSQQKESSELIRSALTKAGIHVDSREKFSVTIQKDGTIKVKGDLGDIKLRRIEQTLNKDPDIAASLRRESLYGTVAQQVKFTDGQANYGLSGATRYALLDDYVRQTYDISLDDLTFEQDSNNLCAIGNGNDKLAAAVAGDPELELALQSVMEQRPEDGYETPEVTFEFSNGMVDDVAARDAANTVAEGVKSLLMNAMGNINGELFELLKDDPEAFARERIYTDTIELTLGSDGSFSISGRMGARAKSHLEDAIGKMLKGTLTADRAGDPVAYVSDLFEQMYVSHQTEWGDVDDDEHTAELRITSAEATATVSSPEADRKILDDAQALANDLGKTMGDALRKKGLAPESPIAVSVTPDGHMVASGGMANDPTYAALTSLIGSVNNLVDLPEPAEETQASGMPSKDGGKKPKGMEDIDKRRADSFMKPLEESDKTRRNNAAREADKARGETATTLDGYQKSRWVEADGRIGEMAEVNDIETVTVAADPHQAKEAASAIVESDLSEDLLASTETEATEDNASSAGGVVHGDKDGKARDAFDEDRSSYETRTKMKTGIAEFSDSELYDSRKVDEVRATLRSGRTDPATIREGVKMLTEMLSCLHDPSRWSEVNIMVA